MGNGENSGCAVIIGILFAVSVVISIITSIALDIDILDMIF